MKGWYYAAQSHQFDGISFHEKHPDLDLNWYGPFKTFSEAKKDAIAFFRTDVREAQRCISEIYQFKKPKD